MIHRRRRTLCLCVLLFSGLGAVVAEGCGSSDFSKSGDSLDAIQRSQRKGPIRAVKWGVGRRGKASVQIGAFVPYCENIAPSPQIEQVKQRRRPGRVILTMYVRFPPRKGRSCIGYDLGVTQWVKLGSQATGVPIYDGSTSPPALRVRE